MPADGKITRTHYILRVDFDKTAESEEKARDAIRKTARVLGILLDDEKDIHDNSITWDFDDDVTEDYQE